MTLMKDSKKESDMLAQLAPLNIGPGKNFKLSDLDKGTQTAMEQGFKKGLVDGSYQMPRPVKVK